MTRVAIIGVGNCAKSLCEFLASDQTETFRPGAIGAIGQSSIGGIGVSDLQVVAAFDVDAGKVGRDLADAILAPPNCAIPLSVVGPLGVVVQRAPTLDGLPACLRSAVTESPELPLSDVGAVEHLRSTEADVAVCLVPTGSDDSVRWWAEVCLAASVSFVNGTPTRLTEDEALLERFSRSDSVLIGDDMKSQLGATVLHRSLVTLLANQGLAIESSSQINIGGNTDFLNLQVRGGQKAASKLASLVAAGLDQGVASHVGLHFDPTRGDSKRAVIQLIALTVCGTRTVIDVVLDVEDSPNSVAILLDAIRCADAAHRCGARGYLPEPSQRLMKAPREGCVETEAVSRYDEFIRRLSGAH